MRVLLIQAASEHSENYLYREALCFQRSLARIKIQSAVWGPGYAGFAESINRLIDESDYIFVLENYGVQWLPDLSLVKKPKVLWIIDSHKNANELNRYILSQHIDRSLVAFRNHLNRFPNSVWFPPCYPADLFDGIMVDKKEHNIGFCGSRGNRGEWLDKLAKDIGLKQDIFILGSEMVQNIKSYKIHFNKNETPDVLAFRTMETLGAGTMLLTDQAGNIHNLFSEGKHLVTYDSYNDCVDKALYYIENSDAREIIAAMGKQEASTRHTYDTRTIELLSIFKEIK